MALTRKTREVPAARHAGRLARPDETRAGAALAARRRQGGRRDNFPGTCGMSHGACLQTLSAPLLALKRRPSVSALHAALTDLAREPAFSSVCGTATRHTKTAGHCVTDACLKCHWLGLAVTRVSQPAGPRPRPRPGARLALAFLRVSQLHPHTFIFLRHEKCALTRVPRSPPGSASWHLAMTRGRPSPGAAARRGAGNLARHIAFPSMLTKRLTLSRCRRARATSRHESAGGGGRRRGRGVIRRGPTKSIVLLELRRRTLVNDLSCAPHRGGGPSPPRPAAGGGRRVALAGSRRGAILSSNKMCHWGAHRRV